MIVEHGYGVANANAYVTVDYVDDYALNRGVTTWAAAATEVKEQAIIKATDYIEQRFGTKFRGFKCYPSMRTARNVLTLTQIPSIGETITIGLEVIVWGTDVASSTTLYNAMLYLVDYVNLIFDDMEAELGYGNEILFTSNYFGVDAELITVETDMAGGSWWAPAFKGGDPRGLSQALSFPRSGMFTLDGFALLGIPDGVKSATAEYAMRALVNPLLPDPVLDASGQVVKLRREKLGPIEEEYELDVGRADALRSYPAADALLRPYLANTGGVVR